MAAIQGYMGKVLFASYANVSLTDEVLTDAGDHTTFNISSASFAVKRIWDRLATFTIQTQCDEVQTVTVTGSPSGGTFVLRFGGQNTAATAFNAAASVLQTNLQALSSIGAGNALVTGSNGGPYTVEFAGSLADASQALITLQTNSLTGGSSPSVSIVEAQAGQAWTTIAATTYTIRYLTGQVLLVTPLIGANLGCRVHAGAYLPLTTAANAKMWELSATAGKLESTVFTGAAPVWKTYVPGLLDATVKLDQWWADGTWIAILITSGTASGTLVAELYTGRSTYERYTCFARLTQDDIKVPVAGLMEEPLTLTVDGKVLYIGTQFS